MPPSLTVKTMWRRRMKNSWRRSSTKFGHTARILMTSKSMLQQARDRPTWIWWTRSLPCLWCIIWSRMSRKRIQLSKGRRNTGGRGELFDLKKILIEFLEWTYSCKLLEPRRINWRSRWKRATTKIWTRRCSSAIKSAWWLSYFLGIKSKSRNLCRAGLQMGITSYTVGWNKS